MNSVPVFCGKDCGGGACPLLLEVEGGRGLRLLANPAGGHPLEACRRGYSLLKEHYAPDRLTTPLIRTGPRGSGEFREAGWEEALALVAARLGDVRARCGAGSVLALADCGCTGALHGTQNLTKRFLNLTGGCTVFTGNYSKGAAQAVLPYLLGSRWTESGADAATMKSSAMVILWGANVLDTRLGSEMPGRLLEAKRRGVPIVAIDPRRTATVRHAATWWIPCRPGTDAALMLAVLHVLLSERLVDPAHVDADFRARMAGYRCGSGTFRMNVALTALPDFACLPGRAAAPHHASGIVIAPSLAYMERAYFDAKTAGWSREPIVEVLIPSVVDDSLAPPGMHVASLFCQHAHPDVASVLPGTTWDDHRDEVADLMIDTVERMAPGFRASVIGRRALSPLDLEREFGLTGGDIFHGALGLDQLYATRPALGAANYRMPVRGLYLCGAGAHPGGGVTGIPGRNAAREILRDARRRK